ncbi:hypothetical protein BaRGS_00015412, partial [Batillaria attramentaria]
MTPVFSGIFTVRCQCVSVTEPNNYGRSSKTNSGPTCALLPVLASQSPVQSQGNEPKRPYKDYFRLEAPVCITYYV